MQSVITLRERRRRIDRSHRIHRRPFNRRRVAAALETLRPWSLIVVRYQRAMSTRTL